jgi:hypothetical protein
MYFYKTIIEVLEYTIIGSLTGLASSAIHLGFPSVIRLVPESTNPLWASRDTMLIIDPLWIDNARTVAPIGIGFGALMGACLGVYTCIYSADQAEFVG